MSDRVELRINGLVVYDSGEDKPPIIVTPPPDDGTFPPYQEGPILGPILWSGDGSNLPTQVFLPAQSYPITPSQAWLDAGPSGYMQLAGGSSSQGPTPAYARLSIDGQMIGGQPFNGQSISVDTFGGIPRPTAPFLLTVELFDADKQPANGYAVIIQLTHTP